MIILDYETRSEANLPVVGAYNYATHPTTDILCLAMYDTETDEKIVFDPCETAMPHIWRAKLADENTLVGAHNAEFDMLIHEYVGSHEYGFPHVTLARWYCTSAQCRVNALPAGLEDAALAAKVANLKNPRGKQLIKLMCIPQEDGSFNEDPALMQEMMKYCMDDVLATVDIYRCTRKLTEQEQRDWLITAEMNLRGVRIDKQLATLATEYAFAEQSEIAEKLNKLTEGVVTKPTQHQRIREYILEAVEGSTDSNDARLLNLMTVHKNGEKKYALDKDVRQSIITAIDDGGLNIYEDVEELIRLLDDASASSVAKFQKMLDLANLDDHRVRGAFIHAGASQTHRFSSKGLQLHNMKRECFSAEETADLKTWMSNGLEVRDTMQTLSKLLRPALIPAEGSVFIVGDWSAIEARALPWLTNDPRAEPKLDLFRADLDVYVEAAKKIGSGDRQLGKVSELSLGYGGAAGAFNAMAKVYGLNLPDYQVQRTVKNWRLANPWAVDMWSGLERAALRAIRSKGEQSYSYGHVTYHYIPQMLGGTLVCELPDGTYIQYPFVRIEYSERGDSITALKAAIKPKADDNSKHWGEVRLWGGLLAENVTQAFCAGLLRNALRELGELEKYLVAHVHDEIVLEAPYEASESVREKLKMIMENTPKFAKGLPLKAKPVIMERYGNH